MKKIGFSLLFLIFLFSLSSCTFEDEIIEKNFEYETHAVAQTADRVYGFITIDKVKYLYDKDSNYASVDSVSYDATDVVIKDSITVFDYNYKVTTIGSGSFDKCVAVKNITIGRNVTTIKKEAFIYSYSLKEIIIPKNVIKAGSFLFLNSNKDLKIYLEAKKLPSGFDKDFAAGYNFVLGYSK